MSMIMSQKAKAALGSVERDRHLLTDKAAMERAVQHGGSDEGPMPTEKERVAWDRFRQDVGK